MFKQSGLNVIVSRRNSKYTAENVSEDSGLFVCLFNLGIGECGRELDG